MSISDGRITTRWLTAAFLLSIPTLGLAQADVDVSGSEADDGYYDQPYPDQDSYEQDRYGYEQRGVEGDYGSDMDDSLPIIYAGDGMRVSIDQIDDTGTYASGTVSIGNQPPMIFAVDLREGRNGTTGSGQIQTPSGPRPLRTWDQSEKVTVAEFEGRRYRLVFQETYGNGSNNPGYGSAPNDPRYGNAPNDSRYGSAPNDPRYDDAPNNNQTRRNAPAPVPDPRPDTAGPKTVELGMRKLGRTHTLLAPKGWKVEGGAWQPPAQAYSWIPSRYITVTSPDGSGVRFKPHFAAIYERLTAVRPAQPGTLNQASGLLNMPMPGNAGEWAQWIERDSIRTAYPDASEIRVVDSRTVPELTQNLRRLYAPMSRFSTGFDGADSTNRADQQAISVKSIYRAGASRWEQIDAFNLFSFVGQVASAFGGADNLTIWGTRDAVSLRAPEGTLDARMPVLLAIVNSLRPTAEYTQQILQLQAKVSQGNHEKTMQTIETYAAISRASYRANRDVNASIMNSYNQRSASQDRGQRNFVNYIQDQQDYADPSVNANVTLPASYDRVFSNGKGVYVLTNDVSFEPGADWSSLRRTR